MIENDDLRYIVNRVTKMQNKAQSLTWGVCVEEDLNYVMFAVGHKSYSGEVLFIKVEQKTDVFKLETYENTEYQPTTVWTVNDRIEVVGKVKEILSAVFPAKNLGGN